MGRVLVIGSALVVGLVLTGCHTLNKTAGVCDCDPPPVASLLTEPPLPPHLCTPPNHHGPYLPPAPRMRPSDDGPVLAPPKVIEVPKGAEGGKKIEK
jgi:hypothetical protein